jgi:zinc transporter ZupT
VLFLPLYSAGAPWLRTLGWNMATIGLAMAPAVIVWPR